MPGKKRRAESPANIPPKAVRATVILLVFYGQNTAGARPARPQVTEFDLRLHGFHGSKKSAPSAKCAVKFGQRLHADAIEERAVTNHIRVREGRRTRLADEWPCLEKAVEGHRTP